VLVAIIRLKAKKIRSPDGIDYVAGLQFQIYFPQVIMIDTFFAWAGYAKKSLLASVLVSFTSNC